VCLINNYLLIASLVKFQVAYVSTAITNVFAHSAKTHKYGSILARTTVPIETKNKKRLHHVLENQVLCHFEFYRYQLAQQTLDIFGMLVQSILTIQTNQTLSQN
jgi:hypothetical protein